MTSPPIYPDSFYPDEPLAYPFVASDAPPPPTPTTPPSTPPRPPVPPPLAVTVFDRNYRRIGRLADYASASVTHQNLGVGTGTLVVEEGRGGRPAAQLGLALTQVVPVVVDDGVQRWTGRVQHVSTDGEPGLGEITATLISDYAHFRAIRAWQVPGAPLSGQSAAEYDVRTGPLVTVAKAYLSANIARLPGARFAVVPVSGVDPSPTVTLKARMTPMDELLEPPCREHGYQLTAQLWLPGWTQPTGLTLTQPTIVLDVRPQHVAAHVLWTDQVGITDRQLEITHPEATTAIVGMKGEGTLRAYTSVGADDGRANTLGPFAFRELYLDATDVDTAAEGQARGLKKLREDAAGTASIAAVVGDGTPFTFGRDFWCGSRVRIRTGGVTLTDTVERVTVTDNRTDGRVVTPQVGASNPTESSDEALVRIVAALQRDLAAQNTRR